jgi:hypothetical protein
MPPVAGAPLPLLACGQTMNMSAHHSPFINTKSPFDGKKTTQVKS